MRKNGLSSKHIDYRFGVCGRDVQGQTRPAVVGRINFEKIMSQTVEFNTADAVKIAADYYSPTVPGNSGIILVHMNPATRSSWKDFAPLLQTAGYQVLAIDLRGHGDSGGGDYRKFSDPQYQASIADLDAAADFLKARGVVNLAVVGASIGANLALEYLSKNPGTKAAVLLSPGLNYRGIKTPPLAAAVTDKNKFLLIGADDDQDNLGTTCAALAKQLGAAQKICFATGGHGTNLFAAHPELMNQIVTFIDSRF